MQPAHTTVPVAAALLVASALAGVVALEVLDRTSPEATLRDVPGADEAALRDGWAGDHGPHHDHDDRGGMDRPRFAPARGTVPTAQEARGLEERRVLRIVGDDAFNPANGVRSGNGSLADPYVISGFYVTGDVYLQDTDACVVVRENYIGGQLRLNWNGQCVHAHHNHVRDLRVNQNIQRAGYATGGLIELNKIEVVGQLRHFDGEFRHNVVGPVTSRSLLDPVREKVPWAFADDPRAAVVDGFNQGLIHHNTFHGGVDLILHGHHHGSGFFATHSHYHGNDAERQAAHDHDHTQRWTSVSFTDNRVVDASGHGLRYTDRNHAANDRTANSEQEESLDEPHVHRTHIVVARNHVEGGPLRVDVFNADDKLHLERNPGTLELVDNTVEIVERHPAIPQPHPAVQPVGTAHRAIHVALAKEVQLRIAGNTLRFTPAEAGPLGGEPVRAVGIDIERVRHANLTIEANEGHGFHWGVKARQFDADTHWAVAGHDFPDAAYPVWWDASVANPPTQGGG